jgi:putative two-component system hydrogenase maturation factor HypX/HoxX
MRVLILSHTFNSLTQRFFVELEARGHSVSVEFDIHESVFVEAVELFNPHLIVAPFLRRAIPESVWSRFCCIVIHPGIPGDKGPSALDRAILRGESTWGVTALQANGEMDGGPVWSWRTFPMRAGAKGSLYRNEVTEAAVECLHEVLQRFECGAVSPCPASQLGLSQLGDEWPLVRQAERRVDWERDATERVLRNIRSADGFPGVLDTLDGREFYLYDAHPEPSLRGRPGELLARRGGAVCRATVDGAVWIGHLQEKISHECDSQGQPLRGLKRSAVDVLGHLALPLPESVVPLWRDDSTWQEINYEEEGAVGFLSFEFYNGAMSVEQSDALCRAIAFATSRPTRVLVLRGGRDFWSNGIHLGEIEAARSAADASWEHICAINRVARAILCCVDKITLSAVRGNIASGGCFLALAADYVFARRGVILNPHYKNMGNLYGSEFWTYVLPRRMGAEAGRSLMERRLPLGVDEACHIGFLDGTFGMSHEAFDHEIALRARAIAESPEFLARLNEKRERRLRDEAEKPLDAYEQEELARMRQNFYGFDPSYHVARYNFIRKIPQSRTPLHLARHRTREWRVCPR